jgi:uncharacterized damage-inducible protein DinB
MEHMIPEVQDQYQLLVSVHRSVDKMVADLSDEQWLKKPAENFNNIASVVEHVVLVERKFLAALAGTSADMDVQAPFRASHWDVASIKRQWQENLQIAEETLSKLTEQDLTAPGLKLGIGELNKRQLLSYMIAHTVHHRGQIPLIKKLLG